MDWSKYYFSAFCRKFFRYGIPKRCLQILAPNEMSGKCIFSLSILNTEAQKFITTKVFFIGLAENSALASGSIV